MEHRLMLLLQLYPSALILALHAPAGFHNDCVVALALANHGRWEYGATGGGGPIISKPEKRQGSVFRVS